MGSSPTSGICIQPNFALPQACNQPREQTEDREIRTPNLLIWSQTRCRCAIPPSVCTYCFVELATWCGLMGWALLIGTGHDSLSHTALAYSSSVSNGCAASVEAHRRHTMLLVNLDSFGSKRGLVAARSHQMRDESREATSTRVCRETCNQGH